MRRRLYFVLANIDDAQNIEKELLLARVEDRHMHFLAKRDMDLGDLPVASVAEKTDIVHGMWNGLVAGGGTGAALGAIALYFPVIEQALGIGSILVFAMLGASFGVWVSATVGASVPNSSLREFSDIIDNGKILLMVDVPKERVEEINALVHTRHPDVRVAQIEPRIPAFP